MSIVCSTAIWMRSSTLTWSGEKRVRPLLIQTKMISISEAAEIIRGGKLVAFPTETVYGLGANALDPTAVARIFEAKGRPMTSPIIVHVSSTEMARTVVSEWPESAELLAQRFWPGPLTL